MESFKAGLEHAIGFWYLLGQAKLNNSFWSTTGGRFVLAIMPALVTAALTAIVTVTGIYLSLRDDVQMLKSMVTQVKYEYQQSRQEEALRSARLAEAEKAIARINGLLERSSSGK